MHTSLATASTINAVLGDASFLHTFGVPPPPYTDERLRISTHLAYVEQLLRSANVEHLASEQQQKRAFLLDKLHEYWQRGRFPKNTEFPDERRPCFIDREGNICAVGYLVEQDCGRAAAERINAEYQYEYVPQMDAPFVQEWVQQSGLSVEECAMIQPGYELIREQQRRWKLEREKQRLLFPDDMKRTLSSKFSVSSLISLAYDTIDKDDISDLTANIQTIAKSLIRLLECELLLDLIKHHPDVIASLRTEKTRLEEVEDIINEVLYGDYSVNLENIAFAYDTYGGEGEIAIFNGHFWTLFREIAGKATKLSNECTPLEVEGRKEGLFYQITFHHKGNVENGLMEKYNDIESILAKALVDSSNVCEWELIHTISILYIYGCSIKVERTEEGMTTNLLIPFEPLEMIPLQELQSLYEEERLRDLQSLCEAQELELQRLVEQKPQRPDQRKTILVIHHLDFIPELIEDILQFEDYKTLTAEDGLSGIEKAKTELPSLIICNMMMPKMNGYEVLQALREHEPTAHIPVILLVTNAEMKEYGSDLMKTGAKDVLRMPFTNDELLSTVKKVLAPVGDRRFWD